MTTQTPELGKRRSIDIGQLPLLLGETAMTTWTGSDLTKIGTAEELEIASLRHDSTLRQSRTIWVVRIGDDLYVRSVRRRGSDWFRGVQTRHEGRIEAGGVEKEVAFLEVAANDDIHDQLDAAYRAKYRHYAESTINTVLSSEARAATIKLVPR
jgi:hypothetical protein